MGHYASLGWYEFEDATYLLGLTYPTGYAVARWTPAWTGQDIEPQLPALARAKLERLCDVRLAEAGASDEQHVLVALDEAARREVDDLGPRDLGVEVAAINGGCRPHRQSWRSYQPGFH